MPETHGSAWPDSKSGQNGNEAVAGVISQAFARWLYRRYTAVQLPSAGHTVSPLVGLSCSKLAVDKKITKRHDVL